MAILITCDCGKAFRASDEAAGRTVKCPACGRALHVAALDTSPAYERPAPRPAAPAPAPAPAPAAGPPPARKPPAPAAVRDELDDEDEYEDSDDDAPVGTSPMCVASLVVGLLSFCVPVIGGLAAIVLGLLGLRDVRRREGELRGSWMSVVGMATGALSLLLVGLILYSPEFWRAFQEGYERGQAAQEGAAQAPLPQPPPALTKQAPPSAHPAPPPQVQPPSAPAQQPDRSLANLTPPAATAPAPAPDVPKLPPPPRRDDLKEAGKIEPYLDVAIAPGAHSVLAATDAGFLKLYSYPELELKGSYRLAGTATRLALLEGRGLLFATCASADEAAAAPPEPPAEKTSAGKKRSSSRRTPSRSRAQQKQAPARVDVHVYDVSAILKGRGDSGSELKPKTIIPLGDGVARVALTPDGRSLFLLTGKLEGQRRRFGEPEPARLVRVDTSTLKVDHQLDLAAGTECFCITPDGKALYAAASPGHSADVHEGYDGKIQVIDPATATLVRTVAVEADPYDMAATDTDRGLVFVSGGSGQHTEVSVVDMKQSRAIVAHWKGPYMGASIRISPDQNRLYLGSSGITPPNISSWILPAELDVVRPQDGGQVRGVRSGSREGEFTIAPDGDLLFVPSGKVYKLTKGK